MGDYIDYRGKTAYLNATEVPKSLEDRILVTKYDLSVDNFDDLKILLSMDPEERIVVNGTGMSYETFQKEILERTHKIYLSRDARLLDQMNSIY